MSSIPATMHCIEIKAPGGPEVLVAATRPVPIPKSGEVLIRVEAAGVNRPDVAQRQGSYPAPPGASDIPGLEVAGEIVALGADPLNGESDRRVGERVTALVAGGGYAQYATAPAGSCLPWPKGFSAEQAAAIPETFFTVWHNVFERGALKAGETLLVHGGSSGIGTTAIQLGKAFGAFVATTAGSDAKCEACRNLGADLAINYRSQDFVEAMRSTAAKGADVILDMVGGSYLPRNLKSLRVDGRLVVIALLGGARGDIDLGPMMMKRQTITGSTLRARDTAFKSALANAVHRQVWPLLEAGRVAPVLFKTFAWSDAAQAHALMESSAHIGKIVLKM